MQTSLAREGPTSTCLCPVQLHLQPPIMLCGMLTACCHAAGPGDGGSTTVHTNLSGPAGRGGLASMIPGERPDPLPAASGHALALPLARCWLQAHSS